MPSPPMHTSASSDILPNISKNAFRVVERPWGVTIGSVNGLPRFTCRGWFRRAGGCRSHRAAPASVTFRVDETVEAVLESDDLDARVAGRLYDGTDHGVQTGGVATSGEDSYFLDLRHGRRFAAVAGSRGESPYSSRLALRRVQQDTRMLRTSLNGDSDVGTRERGQPSHSRAQAGCQPKRE